MNREQYLLGFPRRNYSDDIWLKPIVLAPQERRVAIAQRDGVSPSWVRLEGDVVKVKPRIPHQSARSSQSCFSRSCGPSTTGR
jgi:hypothetical protein